MALLTENLEEKGCGNGGVALLAKSVEVGCGNQGVALLAENLEEKGSGNIGVALLAKSVEDVAIKVWHCSLKTKKRCGTASKMRKLDVAIKDVALLT